MKIESYNILFRLFSFLSDKTNGAPLFVKYKLMLGTLILSLTSSSIYAQKKETTQDTVTPPQPMPAQITCYKPAILPRNINDTITIKGSIEDEHGDKLIGVTVMVKDKNQGTLSDTVGNYSLKVSRKDVIIFSLIGLETLELKVSDIEKNGGDLIMKESPMILCYEMVMIPSNKKQPDISELTYDEVDLKPTSPVGDIDSFQKWVQDNVVYSEQMKKEKLRGEVSIEFAINKKGKLVDKSISKSLSKEADKEVIRIISQSKRWQPGMHNGKPIKTTMSIKIVFDYKSENT